MPLNIDLLTWFGNFVNFLVFAYISISIINTNCFDTFQISLSMIGLVASIFIQIISMTIKQNLKKK